MMARFITMFALLTLALTSGCTFTITPPTPAANPDLNPNGVILSAAQTEANLNAFDANVTAAFFQKFSKEGGLC